MPSLSVVGDSAVRSVANDGIGTTAQAMPRVFEPFARDSHAIGFDGIGLGIGPTVVRALVRAQGGGIAADSRGRQQGSRFVVTLPPAGAGPTT